LPISLADTNKHVEVKQQQQQQPLKKQYTARGEEAMGMSELRKEVARLEARQRALDLAAAAAAGATSGISELPLEADMHNRSAANPFKGGEGGRRGRLGPQSSGPGRGCGPSSTGRGLREGYAITDAGRPRMHAWDAGALQAGKCSEPDGVAETERGPCEAGLPGPAAQAKRAWRGWAGAVGPGHLADLGCEEAQAWVRQMAGQAGSPARLADEVEQLVAWMERASVTGEDLCSMSASDIRDELPGISMAVRKWLKQAIASGQME
jgi:hypothetical protein